MKQNIYAKIATKDTVEYKKGEITEVSLWRKNLLLKKYKWEKVVKIYQLNL